MMKYYKTVGGTLTECDVYEEGVWVYLIDPTDEEIKATSAITMIEEEFLRPALDEEERPRMETDSGQTLVLVDVPTLENDGGSKIYTTIPMGIVLTKQAIVTVCLEETPVLSDFLCNRVKSFYTQFKSRFILQVLYRNATLYLNYLRVLEKLSNKVENELQRSTRNKELTQLLRIEKSLVYFSTSLKSNESVLERMLKLEAIKRFEEDQELLDDVIIENKQAIEMTNIHSSILSNTMDAFASIISNNLSIVMRFFAVVSIALAVASMISGFYGMNVPNGIEGNPLAFPLIVFGSVALAVIISVVLMKRRMF